MSFEPRCEIGLVVHPRCYFKRNRGSQIVNEFDAVKFIDR